VSIVGQQRFYVGRLRSNADDRVHGIVEQPDPIRDFFAGLDHLTLGRANHELGGFA
jgi:hypothetical protein